MRWYRIGLGLLAVTLLALAPGGAVAAPSEAASSSGGVASAAATAGPVAREKALDAYGKLGLAFVPNAGQVDARVRFSAQAGGASFWFTRREAVFAFAGERQGHVLRLGFLGANPDVVIEGARPGAGRINYLIGRDSARWRTGLPTYEEVVYRGLWPGIDLVFRGAAGTLKYEFRLAPGADPSDIRLAYRGAGRLSLDRAGNLGIHTSLGVLRDSRPVSYQRLGGRRLPVASRYAVDGGAYGFALGRYDPRRPLVVDPGLAYSTFLGGTGADLGFGIAVDSAGNAYVTGVTVSADFPTTAGAFDPTFNGSGDAFVTKLDAAGSALAYSTFLGGTSFDLGFGIAVDSAGNAYVTGDTVSAGFPTTPGAFDPTLDGGIDVFVTKLNAAGSALAYSTFLGGTGSDQGGGIAVDSAGNAYVTGYTGSADFPTTPGAFDPTYGGGVDAFVTKLETVAGCPPNEDGDGDKDDGECSTTTIG